MIKLANKETKTLVRQMWKICFGDTEDFMNLYFEQKYKHENTLIYFEKGEAVASLQMLPYSISFYGEIIPFLYLTGLCTLPQHRRKGYMDQLIHASHRIIRERNIPLAILIPAEEWLFGFYEKYGYEQVFEKGNEPLPCVKKILTECGTRQEAFANFDRCFNGHNFCVQKTFEDFETIIEEYKMEGFLDKFNLSGMARVINPKTLLSLYAKSNPQNDFSLRVESSDYHIHKGIVSEITSTSKCDFSVDIRILCRLLFGYKVDKNFSSYFEEYRPIMNLMLE